MILLFCGPVGVGKSTIAKELAKELERRGKNYHLISSDEIRRRVYQNIFRRVRKHSGKVDYLLVDATFYRKEWRKKIREIAKGTEVMTVFVDCSLETCLQRNREREKPIEEKAVHIIYNEFERPEEADIYINTEKSSPKEAMKDILSRIDAD